MDRPYILLVEDNEDDIMLTQRALAKVDSSVGVVVFKDGEAALDACREAGTLAENGALKKPLFILLDLKLPKANGVEIFRCFRSKAATKTVPIVLISSSKEEVTLLASQKLGADEYLFKPITPEKLAELIQRYKTLRHNIS